MDRITKLFRASATTTLAMALILVAAPAEAQTCGACENQVEEDSIVSHWAVAWWNSSGPDSTPNPYHWGTEKGSCRDHHSWCGDNSPIVWNVIDAVEREDVNYLSDLVTASSALIVESRQAIQIPGCDRELIVGHVPISVALMASLRVAVADLTGSG